MNLRIAFVFAQHPRKDPHLSAAGTVEVIVKGQKRKSDAATDHEI